jgi:hypothetical protein
MTPNELFSGIKPSITHLRIFGSPAFSHIPKTSRSKLDPRSEQCILLSFDESAKAYRCYRPSTKKVFISRDILIDEDNSLNLHLSSTPTESYDAVHTPAPTRLEESRVLLGHQSPPTTPEASNEPPSSPIFVDPQPIQVSSPPSSTDLSVSTSNTEPPPISQSPPASDSLRRSERIRRFPRHLQDFAAHIEFQDFSPEATTDHLTFKQAHTNPHWLAAMQTEIDSIYSNNTWTLVPLPTDKRAISSRWVYKIKPGANGNPTRYKARLVARGFEQQDGIDFLDTFAPVVRWETIRILIAIAVHLNWPIHQLDVLTAFLNGILREDVYMHQPPGFITPGAEHLVCKLHKSLYGLRQSPRAWYARLHAALLEWHLIQSKSDPNLSHLS